MTDWRPSNKTLFGFPCLESTFTESGGIRETENSYRDLILAGEYGLIWDNHDGKHAKVYIWNNRTRGRLTKGSAQTLIPYSRVPEFHKKLKVFKIKTKQANIANNMPDGEE